MGSRHPRCHFFSHSLLHMPVQVGVASLMAWDQGVCRDALSLYQRVAQQQLLAHQG